MNLDNFIFSPSSYKEYQQCGLKFRYKRVDKIPPGDEISHHRWYGRLVHELIYAGLAERTGKKTYKLRETPDKEYALSLIEPIWSGKPIDKVSKLISKGLGDHPKDFFPGRIKDLQEGDIEAGWKRQAYIMVGNGIDMVEGVDIQQIETKMFWKYLGHNFIGYIDLIARNAQKRVEFYDYKTAWGKPGKSLQRDFQFYSYSLSLKQTLGLDYFPTGYWSHVKDGTLIPYEVTPEVEEMFKESDVFARLENDVFPANHSLLCKFCDYRELCYGKDVDWDEWKPYD